MQNVENDHVVAFQSIKNHVLPDRETTQAGP